MELGRKCGISYGVAGEIEWGLVGFCLSSSGPSKPVAFPIVVIQSPSRDNMRLLLLQGFTLLFSFSSLLVL